MAMVPGAAVLDLFHAGDFLRIFREFHRVGVTVLVATHDETLVGQYPGRMLRLDHGSLVA